MRGHLEWPISVYNALVSFSFLLLKGAESLTSFVTENVIINSIKWVSEMLHVNEKFCWKKWCCVLCPRLHPSYNWVIRWTSGVSVTCEQVSS